jgi:hypothetical protein
MNKVEKAVATYFPWIMGMISVLVAFRMLGAGRGTSFLAYLCTGKLLIGLGCVSRLLGAMLDRTAATQAATE